MIYDCVALHNLKELKNYDKLLSLSNAFDKSLLEMLDDIIGQIEIIDEEKIQ